MEDRKQLADANISFTVHGRASSAIWSEPSGNTFDSARVSDVTFVDDEAIILVSHDAKMNLEHVHATVRIVLVVFSKFAMHVNFAVAKQS